MFKALLIIGIVVYGASVLNSTDANETARAFKVLNGAVESVTQAAVPHVVAVTNQVIKPAIDQVKEGPEIKQDFTEHDPRVERNLKDDFATASTKASEIKAKVKECDFNNADECGF